MKTDNKFILISIISITLIFISNSILAQTVITSDVQGLNPAYKELKPIVPIKKIGKGNVIHRFHDTSPLSPSGNFVALFRIPFDDHYPEPGDAGEVVLINTLTLEERVIAKSFGWEMQVGANVQWGATDNELFYNDVDTATWEVFTVKFDPVKMKSQRINGPLFMVSQDGKKLVSHNLINSIHAQSGYGVIVPPHLTQINIGLVENDGVFVTDIKTGLSKKIVSIKDIYEKSTPKVTVPNPDQFAIYCFKAMWNPQGTRLMTCLIFRPLDKSERKVAVITMRPDGSDIRTAITHEQRARGGHHMAWMPDGEHISMNLENDGVPGLEVITVKYDGSELKTVFTPGSGHPSFHPKGLPFIITDSYWNEPVTKMDGFIPLRLLNTESKKETIIAYVFVPKVNDSSFRVDLHPAWSRCGRYVFFNGYENNERCVFMADLGDLLKTKE